MTTTPATTTAVRRIPVGQLTANPANVRDDVGDVTDLADSIAAQGLLQPLVVRPAPDGVDFVVIAGHRRLAALQLLLERGRDAGGSSLRDQVDAAPLGAAQLDVLDGPWCLIRDDLAVDNDGFDSATRLAALVENTQRADLTPMEEARALSALVSAGMSQKDVAAAVGRNQGHVSKRLTLLKAIPDLAARIDAGSLPLDVAVDLAKLPRPLQEAAVTDLEHGLPADVVRRRSLDTITAIRDHTRAEKAALAAATAKHDGWLQVLPVGAPDPLSDSVRGPDLLAVSFGATKAAHTAAADAGSDLPCTTWYVRGRAGYTAPRPEGTPDPWPGYDPAWIAGPYCHDPASHQAATTTDDDVRAEHQPTAPTETPAHEDARAQKAADLADADARSALTAQLSNAHAARLAFMARAAHAGSARDWLPAIAHWAAVAPLVADTEASVPEVARALALLHTPLDLDSVLHPDPDPAYATDAKALHAFAADVDNPAVGSTKLAVARMLLSWDGAITDATRALTLGYDVDPGTLWTARHALRTLTDRGHTLDPTENTVLESTALTLAEVLIADGWLDATGEPDAPTADPTDPPAGVTHVTVDDTTVAVTSHTDLATPADADPAPPAIAHWAFPDWYSGRAQLEVMGKGDLVGLLVRAGLPGLPARATKAQLVEHLVACADTEMGGA